MNSLRSQVITALAKAGEAEKILPIFKQLSVDARAQVMWGLRTTDEAGQPLEATPPLLLEGLKDEDKKVRAAAFGQLFIAATKDPQLDAIVKEAMQKEPDDHTRKEMERRMASVDHMRSKGTATSPAASYSTPATTATSVPASAAAKKGQLKVTGINTLATPATATINGQMVEEGKKYTSREGGSTLEYTVVRIESEKVVIRRNGKEETLSLGPSMDDFTEKH